MLVGLEKKPAHRKQGPACCLQGEEGGGRQGQVPEHAAVQSGIVRPDCALRSTQDLPEQDEGLGGNVREEVTKDDRGETGQTGRGTWHLLGSAGSREVSSAWAGDRRLPFSHR